MTAVSQLGSCMVSGISVVSTGPSHSRFAELLLTLPDGRRLKLQRLLFQKEKKDLALIKRFKPCYYSPIQCLIKRR
ncbi:unnamed protein product [Heligmosomoides polygyrus]|uniref:39S ribosomal protein L33, mitochondrial n=1 Tax=Heligmosomoides polygyrus TaxID=6339 RepID=A0A183FEZ7_HELPZ|nr:unnamed protein product [Heligmosomoides polygyrus]